jgi:hypothetical protein
MLKGWMFFLGKPITHGKVGGTMPRRFRRLGLDLVNFWVRAMLTEMHRD